MSQLFEARAPEVTWHAEEVIRHVDHRPHLLVRVAVQGRHFPERALVPFVRIVGEDHTAVWAWFTEISPDSRALLGYFATDLPRSGVLEYGYFPESAARVPVHFDAATIKRLDRARVDKDVIETTTEHLRGQGGPR